MIKSFITDTGILVPAITRAQMIEIDRIATGKTGLLKKITGELFLTDIGIPEAAFLKIGVKYSYPFDKRFLIPITEI